MRTEFVRRYPSSDEQVAKEVTDLIDWQGFFPFDEA